MLRADGGGLTYTDLFYLLHALLLLLTHDERSHHVSNVFFYFPGFKNVLTRFKQNFLSDVFTSMLYIGWRRGVVVSGVRQ